MTVPKRWKIKAFEVLDNIESGRKILENVVEAKEIITFLNEQYKSDLTIFNADLFGKNPAKFGILDILR